jgi:hypothetical protein
MARQVRQVRAGAGRPHQRAGEARKGAKLTAGQVFGYPNGLLPSGAVIASNIVDSNIVDIEILDRRGSSA